MRRVLQKGKAFMLASNQSAADRLLKLLNEFAPEFEWCVLVSPWYEYKTTVLYQPIFYDEKNYVNIP